MPVAMPKRLSDLKQHRGGDDFKKRVLQYITSLKDFRLLGSEVLVATFVQSDVTKGGIIKPDQTTHEDMWQGRAGLLLAMGDTAFKYAPGGFKWEGPKPEVGDWIIFRFADSWDLHLEGVGCRIVDAENVKAIIKNPETAY